MSHPPTLLLLSQEVSYFLVFYLPERLKGYQLFGSLLVERLIGNHFKVVVTSGFEARLPALKSWFYHFLAGA